MSLIDEPDEIHGTLHYNEHEPSQLEMNLSEIDEQITLLEMEIKATQNEYKELAFQNGAFKEMFKRAVQISNLNCKMGDLRTETATLIGEVNAYAVKYGLEDFVRETYGSAVHSQSR